MEIIISFGVDNSKNLLNRKGKSIIDFPNKYVVFDLETTGLDCYYDDIIEIAALKIENNSVIDTFSSLVKPCYPVNSFITELTGITNEMLATAPYIDSIMPIFLSFIREYPLVGHNVNFDIRFLCSNTDQDINNNYIDTLRLSRKLYKDMEQHRLIDMVEALNIQSQPTHRALNDCFATFELFQICKMEAIKRFEDIDNFKKQFKKSSKRIDTKNIIANPLEIDKENPFYEKECVFTGTLEKLKRVDAMQLVVNIGGKVANNVTRKTNYLILGNNDYCKSIKEGKSNKQKKAEQLKIDGFDIEIISEQTFYDILTL